MSSPASSPIAILCRFGGEGSRMRCDTGPTPDRLKVRIMRDNAKCVGSSSDQARTAVKVSLESYSAHPNFQRMAHSTSGPSCRPMCVLSFIVLQGELMYLLGVLERTNCLHSAPTLRDRTQKYLRRTSCISWSGSVGNYWSRFIPRRFWKRKK
jgi:hypothetical protein